MNRHATASLRYSTAWDTADVPLAEAREAVRVLLRRTGHHPGHRPGQDAQLVVSELVTNAHRHAPGPGRLDIEVLPDSALMRISVHDGSPHPPHLRVRDAGRVGGHGLHLVTRLCDRLRTVVSATGKEVVAHVRLHEDARECRAVHWLGSAA